MKIIYIVFDVILLGAVTIQLKTQGDSEGQVNILGGENSRHCQKKDHMNMCLIVKGY